MHDSGHWRREDRTRRLLEREGFRVVPTRGSGIAYGQPFHLVAIGPRSVRFILVESEEEAGTGIEDFPMPSVCTRELWRWEKHARKPRITIL